MSDATGAKYVPASSTALDSGRVQERLERLSKIERPGDARRGRVKLMLDILKGIADGAVADPVATAAALVAGVEESSILRQGGGLERKKKRTADAQAIVTDQLFAQAEKIGAKIAIDETTLDFLYRHSRWSPSSRKEWEKSIRTACSVDRIVRDVRGYLPDSLIEGEADAFNRLKSDTGTLLLTFHGAFVLVARRLFSKNLERGRAHVFGRGGSITTRDVRGALFAALRSLQDGGVLLMASDGPDGKITGTLNVLGAAAPAGEGAAYLAYATNCNTGWYTVVRRGDKFVPVVEPGPKKNTGESFGDFKERLHGFYAGKIEEIFTGDPGSMVLRPGWSRVFHARARGLPIPDIFAPRGGARAAE